MMRGWLDSSYIRTGDHSIARADHHLSTYLHTYIHTSYVTIIIRNRIARLARTALRAAAAEDHHRHHQLLAIYLYSNKRRSLYIDHHHHHQYHAG